MLWREAMQAMRAAIYVRVSTQEQAREGISLDAQEAACRRMAVEAGALDIEVFRDEGFSGGDTKRPALRAMLARLEEFDAIYVWKLDRLSRSVADWASILKRLTEEQVGFASVTERVDATTPMGRAMLFVMATFAELFLDILRENVRSALAHIASTGRRPTGTVYGYRREGGCLVPDPGQAEVVREAFDRYVAGESMAAIGRDLQARGVPTKRAGKFWDTTAVRDVLRNPAYIGKVMHRGEVLDGTHEPIVSEEQWELARVLREQRSRNRGQAVAHLSSLCRCGLCGGHIAAESVQRSRKDGTRLDYILNCGNRFRVPAADRHPGVGLAERKLDAILWRQVEVLLEEGDLADALRVHARKATGPSVAKVEARIGELDRLCRDNLQVYRAGALSLEALQEENRPLLEEQERLRETVSVAGQEVARGLQEAAAIKPRSVAGVIEALRSGSVEQQVVFLGAIFRQVEVFRGRVVLHYQGGILPPQARSTAFRYAPAWGRTDVGF